MSYPLRVSVQVEGGFLADFRSLTITQELFTHHTFALDFSFEALGKSLGIKPDMLFRQAHERLSGKAITISWTSALPEGGDGAFEFKGLITETSIQTNADLTNYYHISGVSPTYLLEDGSQSRSFVKQTVQQIFGTVLRDYPGNTPAHELKPKQKGVLPYVVQYDETNFNFLSRLAAQQGEWLYYDGSTLRLGLGNAKTVAFQSSGVQNFTLTMNLAPGKLQGSYYNYRAHQPLQATAKAPAGGDSFSKFAVQRSQELFGQPHRVLADATLTSQAQLQQSLDTLSAKQTSGLVAIEGHGEAFTLVPGCLLDVRDAMGAEYGKFRVLAVQHELDGDGNYRNQFKGMSGALDTPPTNELYISPAAHSEVAEVIDLADPRNLGRVRVRFQWPVAKPADAESGWLRVSTPYSGDGKGHLFTPEKGSQVLVGYEHGRPDAPLVLGNLFHPQNPQGAKYTTPENHLKGLQTAGGNKVVMSDKKGAQTILLSNSNNKGTAVEVGFKGDGSITIKSNGPVTVLSPNITLEAGDKGSIKLHAKTISMDADEEFTMASKSKSISLKAKQDISADATEKMSFKAKSKTITTTDGLAISGGSTVDIKAGKVKVNS